MYRMLIVDDEPIIVEGLIDLFQNLETIELEVYQAYDGLEALEIAQKLRIDIILSDIQMPGMNGIELQVHINQIWKRCKFIFLTGYNDFDYIQSSIRGGAFDYVLKTEGDEPIIAAVEKAIHSIAEDIHHQELIAKAKDQMDVALPSLRKQYLMELLQGTSSLNVKGRNRFAELAIPLDPKEHVYVIVGRIDQWREEYEDGDLSLFMYSINNIVEEYVKDKFKMAYLVYEHNRMIWLLQPIHTQVEPVEKNEALDNHTWLLGILESIQVACKQYLKILASFVVSSVPYEWEQLSIKSGKLLLLFERGLGLGKEMLLSDERMFAKRKNLVSSRVSRVRLLDQYLLQKDQEQFYEHYDEIMKIVDGPDALQTGLSLEIFYEITAIFITHMNRMDLFSQLSEQFNVSKLLSINEHATWKDVTVFFRELSVHLFASMESENETETHEIVMLVHEYIEMNLANDLSLNVLASHVYLTPFYLSRLFKAKTGTSISDYTTEARIDKAKQLLAETGLKIHEIGLQIGFDSASYFSRFFKKATNMTPQEYRDSNKRI